MQNPNQGNGIDCAKAVSTIIPISPHLGLVTITIFLSYLQQFLIISALLVFLIALHADVVGSFEVKQVVDFVLYDTHVVHSHLLSCHSNLS